MYNVYLQGLKIAVVPNAFCDPFRRIRKEILEAGFLLFVTGERRSGCIWRAKHAVPEITRAQGVFSGSRLDFDVPHVASLRRVAFQPRQIAARSRTV